MYVYYIYIYKLFLVALYVINYKQKAMQLKRLRQLILASQAVDITPNSAIPIIL